MPGPVSRETATQYMKKHKPLLEWPDFYDQLTNALICDGYQYNIYMEELAEFKESTYKRLSIVDAENSFEAHPVLHDDKPLSTALSRILRHGGDDYGGGPGQ